MLFTTLSQSGLSAGVCLSATCRPESPRSKPLASSRCSPPCRGGCRPSNNAYMDVRVRNVTKTGKHVRKTGCRPKRRFAPLHTTGGVESQVGLSANCVACSVTNSPGGAKGSGGNGFSPLRRFDSFTMPHTRAQVSDEALMRPRRGLDQSLLDKRI